MQCVCACVRMQYGVCAYFNPFLVQLMHMQSLIKQELKLRRLLQHVSVYKETIIREPVSA